MIATEFLKMMVQDNETHADSEQLVEVLEVMKAVLAPLPGSDIDGGKTLEDCYAFMRNYAQKHQKNSGYSMGSRKAMEVVGEYLGIKAVVTETIKPIPPAKVNFDDLLD